MEITMAKEQSFISEYTSKDLLDCYDYPVCQESYHDRMKEPAHPHTEAAAQVINNYMADLDLSERQQINLQALAEGRKVVIGGQQAGLFVSPLYTIHKIISIIVLAREQSEKLGEHIIPVFWIAGEDHDFSEVNHAYIYNDETIKMKKMKVETQQNVEDSVSKVKLTDDELEMTIQKFMMSLPETAVTKEIKQLLMKLPNEWTAQFKSIVHSLFSQHGLLLIDSHDSAFRKLERDQFKWLVEHHQEIDAAFKAGQSMSSKPQIETTTNVHLFMSYEGQRQLLMFEEGVFSLSKSQMTFNKDELLRLIDAQPELFSNNVVTRPLMQELMFNTLAFIGGPAEIKYWGELKKVFELAGRKMPVIVPRMRITYLNERIAKLLEKHQLDIQRIMTSGIEQSKYELLRREENEDYLSEIEQLKSTIAQSFERLLSKAENQHITELTEKNLNHQMKQLHYLTDQYFKELKRANHVTLRQLDEIAVHLYPRDGLQERTWHPLQLLNISNMQLFDEVIAHLHYSFDLIVVKI